MSRQRGRPLIYTLHCGNLYGTERMALATLEGLEEYRRFVIAPRAAQSPSMLEEATALGYEVRAAAKPLLVLMTLIPFFIRHRRIDVISTSALHNLICAWLARLFFVRLRQLNVVHGGGEERYSYAKKHRLNKSAVRLVAVSRFVRERLLAHDVMANKIVVVENFLSPSDIAARPRRPAFAAGPLASRPLDRAAVRVAVVSRLDPVKRIELLLEAIETKELGQFTFDVFGSGDLLDAYRDRAKALGGRIHFHGFVADVSTRLPEADLLLHLCPDEPFGLVVLEAFAAGLPVLVPRSGGAVELVEEGVSGMTYPPSDVSALVSCLRRVAMLDAKNLDAIAAEARVRLLNRYSASTGIAAYRRALYEIGR